MKKHILFFCLILVTTCISACSAKDEKDSNKLNVGKSADEIIGENYQAITSELEEAGFTNIETKVLDDLVTGWLTNDGEIEQVEINGTTEFSANDSFDKDSKIVITYHTFPEEESDNESADVNTSEKVEQTENKKSKEDTPEILTIENNEELAALLALKDEHDASVGEFAEKYKGRTIQFNGHVADLAPHGKYKTRYDFLIYAGDYSETSFSGPNFKFEDINTFDLKITNSEIPNSIEVKQNLLITAEVEEYDENSGLFFLKPISTELK